jgi:hypothetical protein
MLTLQRKNMRHSFIGAFCCFLLLGNAGQARADVSIDVPLEGAWHIGYSNSDDEQRSIVEWTLGNQTVENWTQLVTLHRFLTTKFGVSPTRYLAETVATIKEKSPGKIKVLSQSANEVLFEVAYPTGPRGEPPEYGLHRWFSNPEGVCCIQYASKVPLSPSVKAKWIKVLNGTKAMDSVVDKKVPYRRVAESALLKLKNRDRKGFLALVSKNVQRDSGPSIVEERLVEPCIALMSGAGLTGDVTVHTCTDQFGNKGFAFYFQAQQIATGLVQPFAIYMVKEGNAIVVANIDIGKTPD